MKTVCASLLMMLGVSSAAMAESSPSIEQVALTYILDQSLLSSEAGAEVAYRNLVRQARRACVIPGARGVKAVDSACVAELVEKVVVASQSAGLEASFRSAAAREEAAASVQVVSR